VLAQPVNVSVHHFGKLMGIITNERMSNTTFINGGY